ncbi:MAG: protein-glutamate O-methyltransferase CheR [Candidatus Cloacimonetes bacterium]|nr:protein-glutamate O-methyltransferase CheR [Candidatus Cloacimonadota bacterium]
MKENIGKILNLLRQESDYDFLGCSPEMINRRIEMRITATGTANMETYYSYIESHPEECELLMQSLTIKVSSFFRNPLDFEIINRVIGYLMQNKAEQKEPLRIWSAGCASGEEPYSMAILVAELMSLTPCAVEIFATDIDSEVLERARQGIYKTDSLKEVKYGLLNKYFITHEDRFELQPSIREIVNFSFHDQLSNIKVPSMSIYGNFDIVLCRNVMIYYNSRYQVKMQQRLYDSLNLGGYLMLGEAESILERYQGSMKQVAPLSKIYRKNG